MYPKNPIYSLEFHFRSAFKIIVINFWCFMCKWFSCYLTWAFHIKFIILVCLIPSKFRTADNISGISYSHFYPLAKTGRTWFQFGFVSYPHFPHPLLYQWLPHAAPQKRPANPRIEAVPIGLPTGSDKKNISYRMAKKNIYP